MDKSIESIWKEGFMDEEALVAPKLNDLYSQKSATIVDKFTRMLRINLWALAVAGAVALVASFPLGIPYLGVLFCLQMAVLALTGKRHLARLAQTDRGASSYDYLKAFDTWLKGTIAFYTRVYRILYPTLVLTIMAGMWFADAGTSMQKTMLKEFPDLFMLYGLPVYGTIGTLFIALLLGVFAGPLYRLDLSTVYGGEMKKLEELIADMEELRR